MDENLENILKEIKKRVAVFDGENPVLNIQDAIRLAERNRLLYRWAQNGGYYQLRWSNEHTPISVNANEVCAQIYKRILLMVSPDEHEMVALTPEQLKEAMSKAAKPKTTKKAAGGGSSPKKARTKSSPKTS